MLVSVSSRSFQKHYPLNYQRLMDGNQIENRQKHASIERIMSIIRAAYPLNSGAVTLRKQLPTTQLTPHLDAHLDTFPSKPDLSAALTRCSFQAEPVHVEARS